MRKLFFLIISMIIITSSFAQKQSKKERREQKHKRINALIKQEEEGIIAYKRHSVFGAKVINSGYGAFAEIGRMKSVKAGMLYQFEISEYKNPRENKQRNPAVPSAPPLIYGKQNFFYPAKLGVQYQMQLGNKSNKNGISVTGNFGGGLSMGLLRPYYVEVDKAGKATFITYDSPDSTLFLSGPFYSGPSIGKGWSEIKVTPGAYIKTALRFDYGSFNEVVNALEVGLSLDFYSKKIPLLVNADHKQFFFGGYVAFMFGRRR